MSGLGSLIPLPLPLSDADLERFRLRLDRRAATVPAGELLMRKRGQSLEFREYDAYVPGDDVRFVDWRLSLSRGAPWEFWKKSFDTEEALRIVVTVDQSPTMDGVEGSGKRLIAAWLAEALGRIALLGKDRVVLHRLAAEAATRDAGEPVDDSGEQGVERWSGMSTEIRNQQAGGKIRDWLCESDSLSCGDGGSQADGLQAISRCLQPGAVWLIVSDFFCPPRCSELLAGCVTMATQRRCTVAVLELDSWPWERSLIVDRSCRMVGPGVDPQRHDLRFDVDDALLRRVETRIAQNRDVFFDRVRLGAVRSRWSWPVVKKLDHASMFRDWFTNDPVIAAVLMAGGSR